MREIKLEKDRLSFIEQRDGKKVAIEFAKRNMVLYRRHVLKLPGLIARRHYIVSYLEFKAYYLESRASRVRRLVRIIKNIFHKVLTSRLSSETIVLSSDAVSLEKPGDNT
jgi:hypothetical protein